MKKDDKIKIHQEIWYLLIFSILGLLIETIYCFATTGVLESRKGLIIGPFCPIYGAGAVLLISILKRYKNDNIKLFIYGGIYGSIFEYLVSFILEAMYGTRFWDYSYIRFHLNGRICIIYSLFWAILSLIIIKFTVKFLDNVIAKITYKWLDKIIIIFLILDFLITILGITVYKQRVFNENSIKPRILQTIEDKCFSNNIMVKIFPNLRAKDSNGNEIWIKDLIK